MKTKRFNNAFSLWLLAISITTSWSSGEDIDPRGVFFHRFTGPFSGIEWIHIWDIEGQDRYQFSDIRGLAPYDGEILGGGGITWDTLPSQSGAGQFTSQNDATMSLVYQGNNFQSTMRRAEGTDASFITRLESRTQGDEGIGGQWDLSISTYEATTGDLLEESQMNATTWVDGDLLRLTYSDGTYFQGVFEESDHAGFRVVLPSRGVPADYSSFEGSQTSLTQNVLGDFRMTSEDSFSATFLTQSRNPNLPATLSSYVITGTRTVPSPGALIVLGVTGFMASGRQRGRWGGETGGVNPRYPFGV